MSIQIIPPENLEELRFLLVEIKQNKSPIKVGRKAADALGQILELGADQAVLNITTLANQLKVNPSTLTRLSRNLGYAGFTEFRNVLLSQHFLPRSTYYSEKAKHALTGNEANADAQLGELAAENISNIKHFVNSFDYSQFGKVVEVLATSARIRIFSVRQFLSMAAFLSYGLSMIRSDVNLLDSPGLGTAEGLAALSEGDVLVVFSCSPYTQQIVDVCRIAQAEGIVTVAITDRVSSPLVEFAIHSIFVPHKTGFLSNSITAFAFCVECLINATAASLGQSAKDALERRDKMIDTLKIETYK